MPLNSPAEVGTVHRRGEDINHEIVQWHHFFSIPTHPRASTSEHAVVGAGDAPRPMYDLVRPCLLNVDTRGVDDDRGKGTSLMLDVRVMVDGVIEFVGDVGKTKSVCEGVSASC